MKAKRSYIYVSVYQQRMMGNDIVSEPNFILKRRNTKVMRINRDTSFIRTNMDTGLKDRGEQITVGIHDYCVPLIQEHN